MTASPPNYRVILLDIEGTTSSVSFVFDVMFPYVRRELAAYLEKQWTSPQLQATCELIGTMLANLPSPRGVKSSKQWMLKLSKRWCGAKLFA